MDITVKSERRFFSLLLSCVVVLTLLDILEDWEEGVTLAHLFVEGSIMLLAGFGAVYLWRRSLEGLRLTNEALRTEISSVRADAERWRESAAKYLAGLGREIDIQFKTWGLSSAEKEVGLLLLKGFSHKEIATLRGTSEKTIRHQATAIYRKSNLEGRSQLSAFFLEDLLLPGESC